MKKTLLALTFSALAISGQTLAAPGDAVPNTFTNGAVANADQVNANFTEVVSQISELSTTYSFRDYGHLYDTKTFSVIDSAGIYDKELRTFTRTSGQVSYTRDRSLSSARTQYQTIYLDTSGTDLLFTKLEGHSPVNITVIGDIRTMTPGVKMRTESMEIGKSFGSGSVLSSTFAGTSAVIQTSILLAADVNITVNAVDYTGCIQISRHRAATRLGARHDTVSTFCPGVGLVQQLQVFEPTTDTVQRSVIKEVLTCNSTTCVQQ